MVVVTRFLEDLGSSLGGADGLLDVGRKDVLEGTGGRLQGERPIELAGCPGLELEVLPPKGAVEKCRVYAARNAVYQVCVHVPKFSFTLTAKPASADPGP